MSQFGQVTLAFCDIARGRETLTIFECKCAIVRLTGTELPVRKIGRLLQNECDWKRTDPGVNLAQFSTLFCLVADTLSPVTESDHYEVFDSRNKGWIDHRDACRVFMMVAPKFAEKHVHPIFSTADINGVGQISRRYYATTVEELRELPG